LPPTPLTSHLPAPSQPGRWLPSFFAGGGVFDCVSFFFLEPVPSFDVVFFACWRVPPLLMSSLSSKRHPHAFRLSFGSSFVFFFFSEHNKMAPRRSSFCFARHDPHRDCQFRLFTPRPLSARCSSGFPPLHPASPALFRGCRAVLLEAPAVFFITLLAGPFLPAQSYQPLL